MFHRPAPRPRAARLAGALGLAGLLLAGCGNPGDLRSAGPTPTAVAPAELWPDLPPASAPAYDYGEAATETVEDVTVPGGDLRRLDPVAFLKAQATEHPDTFTGPLALDEETAERIARCGRGAAGTAGCPVLKTQYRDLTGDGREEAIIGIRLLNGQLAIRVLTQDEGKLIQVMSTSDAMTGVEIAGRDLVLRAVSGIPGYEYRTVWSWDRHQRAMLPTKDEFLRVDGAAKSPVARPRATAAPSGSAP
ncbi:hypothetical protein ACFWIA_26370 [Streptomyces sp. NPDC127068]|uniref:hypothetical protein n=1 Tax=Streptomyces sp. NPDC127068 TaxID=3347127 RepID=UPI00364F3648